MMYIVSANDGVTEVDQVVQSALARVLLDATTKADKLAVTEVDCEPEEVERSELDGSVVILREDAATRTMWLQLTDDEQKGVERLNQLAAMAMNIRDMVHVSLLDRLLKENSNEVDFERHTDQPGKQPTPMELGAGARAAERYCDDEEGSDQG